MAERYPNNFEETQRVYSKGRRYSREKTLEKFGQEYQIPEEYLNTHSFYSHATKERAYIEITEKHLYVQMVNKQTGFRDMVLKIDKANPASVTNIGLPAPGLHSFGFSAYKDNFYVFGGAVPTEPGYRKNFYLTPERWNQTNNLRIPAEIKRVRQDTAGNVFAFKAESGFYSIDRDNLTGRRNNVSARASAISGGDVVGHYDGYTYTVLCDRTKKTFGVYSRIFDKSSNKRVNGPERINNSFVYEGDLRYFNPIQCEGSRVCFLTNLGLYSLNLFKPRDFAKIDSKIYNEFTDPQYVGKGYFIYTNDDRTTSQIICAYSGQESETYTHTDKPVFQSTAKDGLARMTEDGKIMFYKIK